MRKSRKGFTLVELLIVIGIISMLGVMGIMAGADAQNAASATKIVEDLKMLSSALNMYYADNKVSCDKAAANNKLDAKGIIAGLKPYVRSADILVDTPAAGVYALEFATGAWWLCYTLPKADTRLAQILQNKALQECLYSDKDDTKFYKSDAAAIYYQAR